VKVSSTADLFSRRAPPPGSHPGLFVVPARGHPPRIRALIYCEEHVEEREIADMEALSAAVAAQGVTWIDIQGFGDGEVLHRVRDTLGIHPLAMADVANVPQRPKVEDYGAHHLIITQMANLEDGFLIELEQLSLVLGPGWVVSFQEKPGDSFDGLRERIRAGAGVIRSMGTDFLAYAMLDAVVDDYFPVVEALGAIIDELEDEVADRARRGTLARIHAVRRTLVTLHRLLRGQNDAFTHMLRAEQGPFSSAVRVYLRDAQDHAQQVLEGLDTSREMAIGLMELYLSSTSNRLNEVMKTLTVVATIFIPLTFIAGVYGMNFEHMPELGWRYGYPAVWGVMIAVALGLLLWFRHRGWLEREKGRGQRGDEE